MVLLFYYPGLLFFAVTSESPLYACYVTKSSVNNYTSVFIDSALSSSVVPFPVSVLLINSDGREMEAFMWRGPGRHRQATCWSQHLLTP